MPLLKVLRNGFLALAAYALIVVISSVAADYSYYRQTHADTQQSTFQVPNDGQVQ